MSLVRPKIIVSNGPHSRLALGSGILGLLAVVGAAWPPIRGLAGQWLHSVAHSVVEPGHRPLIDPGLGSLYLVPFLLVLALAVVAVCMGIAEHLRMLHRDLGGPPTERGRSQLATLGVVAGGVGLWLLVRL